MEKVNYLPRALRLKSKVDFIPVPSCIPKRALSYSFIGNDLVVSEFEKLDPDDFCLNTQFQAGIIPSEINLRLISPKIVNLDNIDSLYNSLIEISDGQN